MGRPIFLNARERKKIYKHLSEQWGYDEKMHDDYAFFMSRKKKVFLISREYLNHDLSDLTVNVAGVYFCEIPNENEIRLSIEGSQLIGPKATKNVLEISEKERNQLLHGEVLDKETDMKGFLIIKCNDDYIGCGKCKNGKLLNFVPKTRRILSMD